MFGIVVLSQQTGDISHRIGADKSRPFFKIGGVPFRKKAVTGWHMLLRCGVLPWLEASLVAGDTLLVIKYFYHALVILHLHIEPLIAAGGAVIVVIGAQEGM